MDRPGLMQLVKGELSGQEIASFNPASTRLIVLTWPDSAITTQAAAWIWNHWKKSPQNVLFHFQKGFYDVIRCIVIEKYCLSAPKEIDTFVFMDRDMRPDQAADPMLVTQGDVIGCQYPTGNDRAWAHPQTIHMGLVKVSRKVIEALDAERSLDGAPYPMFFFPREAKNRKLGSCECMYFARRAVKAGFTVGRAGWCGHK